MAVIKDASALPGRVTSIYPKPFDEVCKGRVKRALTSGLGLAQFGVNLTTLEPGAMSSLRHWHANEDEAIYVLEGRLTLVDDFGHHELVAGSAAGFRAGDPNGHHLVNDSDAVATYLEIGTRCEDEDASYSDVDLVGKKRDGDFTFLRKDGTKY